VTWGKTKIFFFYSKAYAWEGHVTTFYPISHPWGENWEHQVSPERIQWGDGEREGKGEGDTEGEGGKGEEDEVEAKRTKSRQRKEAIHEEFFMIGLELDSGYQ
jgi:hypothetical protein